MNSTALDQLLRTTLADRKITPAEKKVLSEWLALNAKSDADLAVARSRAFEIARAITMDEDGDAVLSWLEDAIKLMVRLPGASSPTTTNEVPRAFFSPGNSCLNEIIRQFQNVKSKCDVCVFTITDDRISDAIAKAHRRGVKIRILSDNDKANDLGSDFERLRQAGIACKVDVTPAHMHHKFAIFDDRILLNGSFNWTRSASEMNEENITITFDPVLTKFFSDEFESLWNRLENA